jgi:hypothetical protein
VRWKGRHRDADSAVSIALFYSTSKDVILGHLFGATMKCHAAQNIRLVLFGSSYLTHGTRIKWASESPKITRFFPSEYGTDITHDPSSASEKPHQLKLKVRAYVKAIPGEQLHFTYLVTGPYSDLYIGKSHYDDMGTFDVKAKQAVLLGDGNGRVAFTTMNE